MSDYYAEIISRAVPRAQEAARRHGLAIGQVVAHPSDPISYLLLGVHEDVATVGNPAGKGKKAVQKTFPLDELFDPNVALSEAMQIRMGF